MLKVGFEPVANWSSTYFHKRTKLMASVYVDDLLLAGPKQHLSQGWEWLASVLDLEAEGKGGRKMSRFLECEHTKKSMDVPGVGPLMSMESNMESHLESILVDYCAS